MKGYKVLIVDGGLAIQWEDETPEQAAERARAERKRNSGVSELRREVRDSRIR